MCVGDEGCRRPRQWRPAHVTHADLAVLGAPPPPTSPSAGGVASQRRPAMGNPLIFFAVLVAITLFIAFSSARIANEYQRAVVFRLGRFVGTRGPGLYFLIPLLER